jgi:hypothetical protein
MDRSSLLLPGGGILAGLVLFTIGDSRRAGDVFRSTLKPDAVDAHCET